MGLATVDFVPKSCKETSDLACESFSAMHHEGTPPPHKIVKMLINCFIAMELIKNFLIFWGVVGHAPATFSKNVDNYGF